MTTGDKSKFKDIFIQSQQPTKPEGETAKFHRVMEESIKKVGSMSKKYYHSFDGLKRISVNIEKRAGKKVAQLTLGLYDSVVGKRKLTVIHPTTRPRLSNGKDNFIEWDQLEDRLAIEQADSVEVREKEKSTWSVVIQAKGQPIAFIRCKDILNLPQHFD